MKQIHWNSNQGRIILDALHNASPDLGGKTPSGYRIAKEVDVEYGKGVIVGVVAGLMHGGHSFDEAWEQILRRVTINPRCIPAGWPSLADYDGKGVTT